MKTHAKCQCGNHVRDELVKHDEVIETLVAGIQGRQRLMESVKKGIKSAEQRERAKLFFKNRGWQ